MGVVIYAEHRFRPPEKTEEEKLTPAARAHLERLRNMIQRAKRKEAGNGQDNPSISQ